MQTFCNPSIVAKHAMPTNESAPNNSTDRFKQGLPHIKHQSARTNLLAPMDAEKSLASLASRSCPNQPPSPPARSREDVVLRGPGHALVGLGVLRFKLKFATGIRPNPTISQPRRARSRGTSAPPPAHSIISLISTCRSVLLLVDICSPSCRYLGKPDFLCTGRWRSITTTTTTAGSGGGTGLR